MVCKRPCLQDQLLKILIHDYQVDQIENVLLQFAKGNLMTALQHTNQNAK